MVGTVLVFPHKKEPRSRDGVGPPSLKNKFHLLTCLIVLYTLRYFPLLFASLYEIKFNFFCLFSMEVLNLMQCFSLRVLHAFWAGLSGALQEV